MVFPALSTIKEMVDILKESKKVLKDGRPLLIVVANSGYDHYMQTGLFGRMNVRTTFRGYFRSGIKYKTQRESNGKIFHYEDYHWTLSDYMTAIERAGYAIMGLDECPPGEEARRFDRVFYEKRMRYPTYLLLKVIAV